MATSRESAEQFVGEPVTPVPGTADVRSMATGAPGLPRRFRWRGRTYEVEAVLATRRTLGPCTSGSGELYVRRHWFTIRTTSGETMTLYFDRQPRRGQSPKARWWLFSTAMDPPAAGEVRQEGDEAAGRGMLRPSAPAPRMPTKNK